MRRKDMTAMKEKKVSKNKRLRFCNNIVVINAELT